jgi:tetratricopeptide (TPR) repeat protein
MNRETEFNEQEKRYLKAGYDYIRIEDWDGALKHFEKVLEINPSNAWAHIEIAKLYRNKTEFRTAEDKFKKALNLPLDAQQAQEAHISLGEIYRLLGKYNLAAKEFDKAREINPNNERLRTFLARAKEVRGFRKEIPPYRVFFTWRIHYQCNYRCSYCNAPKPEKPFFEQEKRNVAVYQGLQRCIESWRGVYEKYGSCRIRLDGGEPSVYPSFIELVEGISQYHYLQINTNLSFDIHSFLQKVNPERVRLDASFHPEYLSLEDFVDRIRQLRANKFKIVVAVVAYPPFLNKISEYKRPIEELHIPFIVHPFSGEFNRKSYPRDYRMEEVSRIYSLDEASRLIMSWRKGEDKTTRGRLCHMGQMYATIFPNGEVFRCCVQDNRLSLGSLFDGGFKLLDSPLVCNCQSCPCWRCMIVTEEEHWTKLWMDDWEIPC